MPRYISADRIAVAVRQLGASSATQRLIDFLIVKRTIVWSGEQRVTLSTKNEDFQAAMADVMSSYPVAARPANPKFASPFVNVYGTAEHSDHGFRSAKYPSNGTSVTVPRWSKVINIHGTNPRVVSLKPDYLQHLGSLLLKNAGALPNILDSAFWLLRASDLESFVPMVTSEADIYTRLIQAHNERLGLDASEIGLLFQSALGGAETEPSWLTDEIANPDEYLPGPGALTTTAAAEATDCSLDVVVALAARRFAILCGVSGTGKSRAALGIGRALEKALGKSAEALHRFVPVESDWTDTRPLLGYRHPFGPARKVAGQDTNETYEITKALRLLLNAAAEENDTVPHLLILDEMNLSHVERYFSTVLSLLEANRGAREASRIPLLPSRDVKLIAEVLSASEPTASETSSAKELASKQVGLPLLPNTFVVGTVNVDETTYMFSPKVLDRAQVLELESISPQIYIAGGSAETDTISGEAAAEILRWAIGYHASGDSEKPPTAALDDTQAALSLPQEVRDAIQSATTSLLAGSYTILDPVGFGFGFRVVNEVFGYMRVWLQAMHMVRHHDPEFYQGWEDALDRVFSQKILPKIHGNRRQLGDSLTALSRFLDGGHRNTTPPAVYELGGDVTVGIEPENAFRLEADQPMSKSRIKLAQMQRQLGAMGYVTFVR